MAQQFCEQMLGIILSINFCWHQLSVPTLLHGIFYVNVILLPYLNECIFLYFVEKISLENTKEACL